MAHRGIAQLAERRPHKPHVTGSSPVPATKDAPVWSGAETGFCVHAGPGVFGVRERGWL